MVEPQNQHTLAFSPESCVDVLDSLSLLDSMRGFEGKVEVEVEGQLMDEEYELEEKGRGIGLRRCSTGDYA
jgi:hypothetical protein